jgi:LmbE family N-acetylglucosaminyl deacetylase
VTRVIATILAHPDDAELWAGGTLIAHEEHGDRTAVVTFAKAGDARALEAAEGARLMGAECLLLEPELLRQRDGLAGAVEAAIISLRAETLITHWAGDSHPDHTLVHRAVITAATRTCIAQGIPSIVFSCDTYYSQGRDGLFQPMYYVDISRVLERKVAAARAHRTQPCERWLKMARDMAVVHGARCGCEYAEGFGEVPILGRRLRRLLLPDGLG